jgi:type IV pilus assembly protein PilC
MHEQKKIRDKIQNALAYPLVVLTVAVIGMILLAIFVFPQFTAMMGSLNTTAADGLQERADSLETLSRIGLLVAVIIAAAGITLFLFRHHPSLQHFWHGLFLKLPLIGRYQKAFNMYYLLFSLENLLQGGFTMDKGLDISREVMPNTILRQELLKVQEGIKKGKNLSASFQQAPSFPQEVASWFKVGEKTGKILPVLSQLRESFQEEVENSTKMFINLVEPGVILLVGLLMMGIIVNFIAPLFSMFGNML